MKYAHPYRIWFLVGLGAMVGLGVLVHRLSARLPITVLAKAHDCFADAGHPTTMLQLEGVGHRWAKDRGINETIWQFLSDHELQ